MKGEQREQEQDMNKKISFSVKKQEKVELKKDNLLNQDDKDGHEEERQRGVKRGIVAMENGTSVLSANDDPHRKREKKEYVIPMRMDARNLELMEKLKKLMMNGDATDSDKARLALLMESMRGDKEELNIQTSTLSISSEINHVSNGDDNDPDSLLCPDYQAIPIAEFGTAFLRGCGWKQETGIGRTNQKAVPLKVSEPRPKGLGLGASLPGDPTNLKKNGHNDGDEKGCHDRESDSGRQRRNGTDDEANDELKLSRGSYVTFLGGLNKGTYGRVASFDEDNASVFVELLSLGKIIRVNQYSVRVVSRAEVSRIEQNNGVRNEKGRK